jgi:hypothetical protein
MCLIGADFKRFHAWDSEEFRGPRNHSSIMPAKVSSIMRANAGQGTFD